MRALRTPFLLLVLVMTALVALPAVASASRIEDSSGILLAQGTALTGEASQVEFETSFLATIPCESWTAYEKLTKNDGTTVEASGSPAFPGTTKGCKAGSSSAPITDLLWENFKTVTLGVGTVFMSFTQQLGASTNCKWSGTLEFTYSAGSSRIDFNRASGLKAYPVACGTARLTANFNIKQTSGAMAILR